jgi:N-acetylglutamate synthase-like GNAT family acetyltransferase
LNTKVRWASVADAAGINDLIQRYVKLGRLLPRSTEEIVDRLGSFLVSEQNSSLAGCVSLEVFTSELGEVRSLAVNPNFARLGHGRMLVEQLEVEARRLGLQRLMALTYVPDFFDKLGFKTTAMDTLPEKVFGVCVICPKFNHCDEIAMVKSLNFDSPDRSTGVSV